MFHQFLRFIIGWNSCRMSWTRTQHVWVGNVPAKILKDHPRVLEEGPKLLAKAVKHIPTKGWQSMPTGSIDAHLVRSHSLRLSHGWEGTKDKPQSKTTDQQDGPLLKGWIVDGLSVDDTVLHAIHCKFKGWIGTLTPYPNKNLDGYFDGLGILRLYTSLNSQLNPNT